MLAIPSLGHKFYEFLWDDEAVMIIKIGNFGTLICYGWGPIGIFSKKCPPDLSHIHTIPIPSKAVLEWRRSWQQKFEQTISFSEKRAR